MAPHSFHVAVLPSGENCNVGGGEDYRASGHWQPTGATFSLGCKSCSRRAIYNICTMDNPANCHIRKVSTTQCSLVDQAKRCDPRVDGLPRNGPENLRSGFVLSYPGNNANSQIDFGVFSESQTQTEVGNSQGQVTKFGMYSCQLVLLIVRLETPWVLQRLFLPS